MPRSTPARAATALAALGLAALSVTAATTAGGSAAAARSVTFHPTVADYAQVSTSQTPPTQAQCISAGRRCFTPASTRAAYDVNPLYANGYDGRGITIGIVDAYGSDTMAHDLHVYDQAFGVQPMCGEQGVTCAPGMPHFSEFHYGGNPATKAPPSTSNGTGQEDKSAWALEVSLDVETAHAMAPMANILLITTNTAETLGVQGFPNMMNAEQYVIDHHMVDVISQSFASGEDAFGSAQSLLNLRHAYVSAAQNGVTVLGSSGDSGSTTSSKTPVGQGGTTNPNPGVEWPASDPLVTGVGGTYLCTDATATSGRIVDSVNPPGACQNYAPAAEAGWIVGGGGYSHIFTRPAYQDDLPAGSTFTGSMRGVPDVALQASALTGALVYISLPPDGQSGLRCPVPGSNPPSTVPCSTGWYDIGGTSLSCPQWAGLVAIADQINGGGLGLINPALYRLGTDPATYARDFYDVTVGTNAVGAPDIPGYTASPGWDAVTGLGTPNAAELLPDLVAAARG